MTSQQQKSPSSYQPQVADDTEEDPANVPIKEITRNDALITLLTDEDLSDLTLRGTDGVLVIANRCLLASRSPVFRSMLYGKFSEATKTVIDLGYDGAILQGIVDYIYTDRLPAALVDGKIVWNVTFVHFLLTLLNAANYFGLPDLCQKLQLIPEKEMNDGTTSCAFDVATFILAVCSPDCDDSSTTVLHESALKIVKRRPSNLLDGNHKSVSMIHPSNIEEIVKYEDLPLDEQSCFQILQVWANAEELEGNKSSTTRPNSDNDSDWRTSRKRIAAEMTNHIRFEDINAMHLSTTVSESGLVTPEQLNDAYKTQALRACKKLCIADKKWRGRPVWKNSESTLFEYHGTNQMEQFTETLDCPILMKGVHKWSIRIKIPPHSESNLIDLGVASMRRPILPLEYLSNQEGGWVLSNREALHAVGLDGQIIQQGMPLVNRESIICFTLDLDGDGVLSASVDGDVPVELFSGMLQSNGEGVGFVPAASCRSMGGSVEFLGFNWLL